jgi:hypothetical protein
LNEYISISSVTATYGSALTAGHFWRDLYGPDTWLTGRSRSKSKARSRADRYLPDVSRSKCGRGLAPDGGVSAENRLTDPMPSGASPLPHVDPIRFEKSGRLSGRLGLAFDFDLERPPNPCRITGTPSVSEVPSVGARAFCLLLRFSKVSRCKSGTISGRYLNNGYVLRKKGPKP